MPEHKYHLAKWNERNKSLRCPQCGGKGCYKEYVDANGTPIDAEGHTVGRCDHQTNCGYHLTPRDWIKQGGKVNTPAIVVDRPEPIRIEIPYHWVNDYYQNTIKKSNPFLDWAYNLPLTDEQRERYWQVLKLYAIGTTEDGRIIYWQIDENHIVRTGKIMRYDQNGHRLKNKEGQSIGFNWVHAKFQRLFGLFPEGKGYRLQQCLFGQHLLPIAPNAEIHIVESEKTAIIMALLDSGFVKKRVWLATGGLENLNKERLCMFKGRKIICYPDANGVEKWQKKLEGTGVTIATNWLKQLKDEDGNGADVADVAIRRMKEHAQSQPPKTLITPFPPSPH